MVISAWLWCIFQWNLVQISLSNPELFIFFQNSRRRPALSWICLGEKWDHPRSLIRGAYLLQKFCHDRLSSFQVIRIWIFSCSGLKVLFTAPKFQFLEDFTPKISGAHRSDPKRHFLEQNDAFWALIHLDLTHSATCGVGKKRKKKKKRLWQTGYSPRPPTSLYRSQSLHAGWPPVHSSIYQVLLKSVRWFCRCGWSKIALPHYFGHRLIQQLVLPYKPWLVKLISCKEQTTFRQTQIDSRYVTDVRQLFFRPFLVYKCHLLTFVEYWSIIDDYLHVRSDGILIRMQLACSQ